jgi:predicted nucleic acid-binding protein
VSVVLDQRALDALAGDDGPAKRRVRQAMVAAARLRRNVVVPTVVLAELYRGGGRNHLVDALLAREEQALVMRDTDGVLARLVGGVLAVSGSGSEDLADAHVVAVAVERGGGVVLTGDPRDMSRLSGPYRTVVIETLPSR